jgi:hypothetical protein
VSYLYKLYFFDPAKQGSKRELHIASSAIDFFTSYKKQDSIRECTRLQTGIVFSHDGKMDKDTFVSHCVEALPENLNSIAFSGLFMKTTVQYIADGGAMKKYSSWINPNNVVSIYSVQPDCCECFFSSGNRILISGKLSDVITAFRNHVKEYRKRRNENYEQKPKTDF